MTFNRCIFTKDGPTAFYDSNETCACGNKSAGLAIFTYLLKPIDFFMGIPTALAQFLTTEFVGKAAQVQGGGIFAYVLLTENPTENFQLKSSSQFVRLLA